MKNFRYYLEYIPVLIVMKLAERTPRRVFHFFAFFIARIGAFLPPFGGLVRKNLRAAFPERSEREIRRMSRESLNSLFLTICEFFWFHNRPDVIGKLVRLTPEYHRTVEEIRSLPPDRPVILITPHFGNWELSGMILAELARFKMATVVRTPRNPLLDRLISSGRMVRNVKIIHSKGGMVQLLHELERGYFAGMLIDQNTRIRNGGVFVDFFGLPCPVSRFPAMIAKKKNAYLAVGGTRRNPDGMTFTATLLSLPRPVEEYESEETLTSEIMALSEKIIREAPEQYLWMYKRFQYIPPEASPETAARYPDYAEVPSKAFFDYRAHKNRD